MRLAGPVICGNSESRAAQLPRGSADRTRPNRVFTALLKTGLPRTREGAPSPASPTDDLRHVQKPTSPEREREGYLHTPRPIICNTWKGYGMEAPVNNGSERATLALPLALRTTPLLKLL